MARTTVTDRADRSQPGPIARVGLAVGSIVLIAVLAAAASVEPDARGYGTHRRFGLPPCSFRALTGRPCPTCGMTTAWAYLVRGQAVRAVLANAGGAILGLGAATAAVWMAVSALAGTWWIGRPEPEYIGTASIIIGGIILLQWSIRLITG